MKNLTVVITIALSLAMPFSTTGQERKDGNRSTIEKHYAHYDFLCVVELVERDPRAKGPVAGWRCRIVKTLKGNSTPALTRFVQNRYVGKGAPGDLKLVGSNYPGNELRSFTAAIRMGEDGTYCTRVLHPKGGFVTLPLNGLTPAEREKE